MEEIHEVQLINKDYNKIKVACCNEIDNMLLCTSWFVLNTSNDKRVAAIATMGDTTVSIWESGEDGIYRNKMDINITLENKIMISKMSPKGKEDLILVDIVI